MLSDLGFLYSDTTDRSFLFHILFSYFLFYVARLKKKNNLGTVEWKESWHALQPAPAT